MIAHRYQILNFLTALAVIVFAFSFVAAQDSDGVSIFNGRDASGQSQPIPAGVYQVSGKSLGAEVSVRVAKGYFVRFCAGKDGSGKCEEFGEGTHNLSSTDFNFIKVWKGDATSASPGTAVGGVAPTSGPPPVVVFEQKNWGGRSQVFGPGMYRSFRGEFGKINDNQAMSVVVAKGFRARFCADEGLNFRGGGDCEIHEEGKHNLRFANAISFIEVTDLADKSDDEKMGVVLYEDSSQTGKMQGFDVGVFLASQGHFKRLGNDKASSIAVRDGYRASVCSDEPASGGEPANCEEFGSGKKNLKNKKAASYLKVWKESN